MSEQEYFTVHHRMTINVEPVGDNFSLPDQDEFESEIPAPFVVASEFSQLDHLNDNARMELKSGDFKHVITLLDNQNAKLNLLLTFMLAQQDQEQWRHHTVTFGASQFTYLDSQAATPGMLGRVKLFLEHPPAAIYCYARVTECIAEQDNYRITMQYERLRDADQDLLIKAALYQQQKLLRQRSMNRNK
ncbi:PilZ domain-containing protein [Vibrio sp.]|uniref:PilZ domain-containing protein n=1 Tax=Vibrio sp. TaxID=678 RepID=UPI003D10DA8C